MKENENNTLRGNALEQVAGGLPDTLAGFDREIREKERLLKGEREAFAKARERSDSSPGAELTAQMAFENIESLTLQLQELIEGRAQLARATELKDLEDLR